MSKNKKMIILLVLALLLTTLIGFGVVYAKYITKITGNATIDIAEPIINITNISDNTLKINNTTSGLVYGFKINNYNNDTINQIKQNYTITITSLNPDIFSVIDYSLFKVPTLEDLNNCLNEFEGYNGSNKTLSPNLSYTQVELNNNKTGEFELKIDDNQNDYYFIWIKDVISKDYSIEGNLNVKVETLQKSN